MNTATAIDLDQQPTAHSDEPWLVVCTAPRFVNTLQAMAYQAGAFAWSPVYACQTRVGPNRKPAVRYPPVFPGYAFLPASHWEWFARAPTRRYQVLRTGHEQFVHIGPERVRQIAEQEAEACKLQDNPKPVEQFAVGDIVQPMLDLFGPMEVQAIRGNTLELEMAGFRLRVDAAAARKVA